MTQRPPEAAGDEARFSCTACGKCCNSGPEMELSEATALADRLVTSVVFKVHSLPSSERSAWAKRWWSAEKSRVPLRAALEEKRRHLAALAIRKAVDKQRDRHRYLTISAMAHDYGLGRCPALAGGRCAIYADRPMTCRTVPLHYSRALSTLADYLSSFTATPGFECDTSAAAPILLRGRSIADGAVRNARDSAVRLVRQDRAWKALILQAMDDPEAATAAGLPTTEAVLAHSDNGYATTLPMIAAWRILRNRGALPDSAFRAMCRQQAALIQSSMAAVAEPAALAEWADLLSAYEQEPRARPAPGPTRNPLFLSGPEG